MDDHFGMFCEINLYKDMDPARHYSNAGSGVRVFDLSLE